MSNVKSADDFYTDLKKALKLMGFDAILDRSTESAQQVRRDYDHKMGIDQIAASLESAGHSDLAACLTLAQFEDLYVEAANPLKVGETFETPTFRVHRYRPSLRFTELKDAGKRGKRLQELILYDTDRVQNETVKENLEKLYKGVHKVKSFQEIVKWLDIIVKDAKTRGDNAPKLDAKKVRGVDVAPYGFEPINIKGKYVEVSVTFENFSVNDLQDKTNEPSCISRGKRQDHAKVWKWAKNNASKIKTMTMSDVMDAWRKLDVDYHYYCRMD